MTKCGSMMTLARPLPLSLLQYCPTPGAWPMELASEACYPKFFIFFFGCVFSAKRTCAPATCRQRITHPKRWSLR